MKKLEERDKTQNPFIKVEVKKVKKLSSDSIEVELRFINDTSAPIELTQLILTLEDEDKNEFIFDLCNMEAMNKVIYGQERRREVFEIKLTETGYNAVKNKGCKLNVRWIQAY